MSWTRRGFIRALLAASASTAAWGATLHLALSPEVDALIDGLLSKQLAIWESGDGAVIKAMRETNAEWDFMGRTFLVLALANTALRDPGRVERHLSVMDAIIADTLQLESKRGQLYFLMSYARSSRWLHPSGRSIFVDGEIAIMLGARRLLQERADYRDQMRARLAQVKQQMEQGEVLCAESYPDECWTFCNTFALVALKLEDALEGRSTHAAFCDRWVERAQAKLLEPRTGMLISSFHLDGRAKDGPEGSSIWFSAHCLLPIAPEMARAQYALAREHLGETLFGFGWAKEWPAVLDAERVDVDSGPIVPVLEASAGSSGHAIIAAKAFGDTELLEALLTSLEIGGFPDQSADGQLTYRAGNQVADSVLLYALSQGPIWDRLAGRAFA